MASSIKTVSHATPHPRYVRMPGLPHDPDERFPGRAGLLSRPRCEAGDFSHFADCHGGDVHAGAPSEEDRSWISKDE